MTLSKETSRTIPREDLKRLVGLLAAKRQKVGMSQRELSRKMGLYDMAVMELERGGRGLQVTELIDAARILDEDPVQLLRECLERRD